MSRTPTLTRNLRTASPSDYSRLGLRRGECNASTIGQAARMAVRRLAETAQRASRDEIDQALGRLTASAYRLLDPRYRLPLYERVQLCYALDREEAEPRLAHPFLLGLPPVPHPLLAMFEERTKSLPARDLREPPGRSIDGAREFVNAIRHLDAATDGPPAMRSNSWRRTFTAGNATTSALAKAWRAFRVVCPPLKGWRKNRTG